MIFDPSVPLHAVSDDPDKHIPCEKCKLENCEDATHLWPASALPHWQRLDLANLQTWVCPPVHAIIDQIITRQSLVYVGAETQTGKSLLFLHTMPLLVQGGKWFGRYPVTPVERVGYIVLEDPAARLKKRFTDLLTDFPIPLTPDACVLYVAPGFTLIDPAFKLWLEHLIVHERRQVLVVDTYQKATPGLESFDDKAQGPILHYLADLTRRYPVTIIVIDHLRKATTGRRRGEITIDDIKGSGGKAQNADAVILMARSPDRQTIRFQAFSKDFDDPVRILIRVAPQGSKGPKFTYVGDLDALGAGAQAKGAATRALVLAALTPEWVATSTLATALKLSEATVRRHLNQLVTMGAAEAEGEGKYRRYRRSINQSSTDGAND